MFKVLHLYTYAFSRCPMRQPQPCVGVSSYNASSTHPEKPACVSTHTAVWDSRSGVSLGTYMAGNLGFSCFH